MLKLAQTAFILKLPTNVTFEGDGEEFKPVYAIRIIDK